MHRSKVIHSLYKMWIKTVDNVKIIIEIPEKANIIKIDLWKTL